MASTNDQEMPQGGGEKRDEENTLTQHSVEKTENSETAKEKDAQEHVEQGTGNITTEQSPNVHEQYDITQDIVKKDDGADRPVIPAEDSSGAAISSTMASPHSPGSQSLLATSLPAISGGYTGDTGDREWRHMDVFSEEEFANLHQYMRDYKPQSVPSANILLLGQIGAGKSSFVNSVATAVSNKLVTFAHTQDASNTTVTTKYDYYDYDLPTMEGGQTKKAMFRLYDSMGLEEMGGLTLEDAKLMLDGRLAEGTKLTGQDKTPRERSRVADMIHLLLIVVRADSMEAKQPMHTLQQIVEYARSQDIQVAAILTHIDTVHITIQQDIREVFQNNDVCVKVEELAGKLHISRDEVLPLVNYSPHDKLNEYKSINILYCLKRMLNLCDMSIRSRRDELGREVEREKRYRCEEELNQPERRVKWRSSFETEVKEYLAKVQEYKPVVHEGDDVVKRINVLQIGQIGVGKTSYVNSLASVLVGRMKRLAEAYKSDRSCTTELTNHKFKLAGSKNSIRLVIRDVMGLEEDKGLHKEDLKPLVKGAIHKTGLEFRSDKAIKDKQHANEPPLANVPHVVALFVDSNTKETSENVWNELKKALKIIHENAIGFCVVITKIDILDTNIAEDITAADTSIKLQKVVSLVAEKLDIQPADIYVVKNYTEEQEVEDNKSKLILRIAKRFLELGDDMLERRRDTTSTTDEEDEGHMGPTMGLDLLDKFRMGAALPDQDDRTSHSSFPSNMTSTDDLADTVTLPDYMVKEVEESRKKISTPPLLRKQKSRVDNEGNRSSEDKNREYLDDRYPTGNYDGRGKARARGDDDRGKGRADDDYYEGRKKDRRDEDNYKTRGKARGERSYDGQGNGRAYEENYEGREKGRDDEDYYKRGEKNRRGEGRENLDAGSDYGWRPKGDEPITARRVANYDGDQRKAKDDLNKGKYDDKYSEDDKSSSYGSKSGRKHKDSGGYDKRWDDDSRRARGKYSPEDNMDRKKGKPRQDQEDYQGNDYNKGKDYDREKGRRGDYYGSEKEGRNRRKSEEPDGDYKNWKPEPSDDYDRQGNRNRNYEERGRKSYSESEYGRGTSHRGDADDGHRTRRDPRDRRDSDKYNEHREQ